MTIDDLKQIAQQLNEQERGVVIQAAHAIGMLDGKKQQIADLIRAMELEAGQDDEADAIE